MSISSSDFPLSQFGSSWTEINEDLVTFVRASFQEHPFNAQTSLASSSPSVAYSSFEGLSLSGTYTKVYTLVSGLGRVEGQYHRQELLLRVMATSIAGWLKLMCDATGGRLKMPQSVEFSKFKLQNFGVGLAASSVEGVKTQRSVTDLMISNENGVSKEGNMGTRNSSERYGGTALLPFTVNSDNCDGSSDLRWKSEASQRSWEEIIRQTREAWGKWCASGEFFLPPPSMLVDKKEESSTFGSGKEPQYAEQTIGMHAVLTLAHHFQSLQNVLSVVFLRLESRNHCSSSMRAHLYRCIEDYKVPETKSYTGRSNVVNELYRYMVSSFLRCNLSWIGMVLKDITSFTIGREELDLLWSVPLPFPCSSAVYTRSGGCLGTLPLKPSTTEGRGIKDGAHRESATVNASTPSFMTRHNASSSLSTTQNAHREGYPTSSGVNLKRVFCIYTMIEECGVDSLLESVVQEVVSCCQMHGQKVANSSVGALLHPPQIPLPPFSVEAREGRTAATNHSEKGGVAQANQALREALQGFVRLRSALMMFSTGTTHYMDALTPHGRDLLIKGLKAFTDGLTVGPAVLQFAEQWGVSMWVQLCKETSSARPLQTGPDTARGGRRLAATDGRASQKAPPFLTPSSLGIGGAAAAGAGATSLTGAAKALLQGVDAGSEREASSMASFVEVVSCSTNAVVERERDTWLRCVARLESDQQCHDPFTKKGETFFAERETELQEAALLPGDGLPTFLYLFARQGPARKRVLMCLAQRIHWYLKQLLDTSVPDKSESSFSVHVKTSFQPLPPNVFEMCVFMLKMTQSAFGLNTTHDGVGSSVRGINTLKPHIAQNSFTSESSAIREELFYLDIHDFDSYESKNMGEIALSVVCRGLRSFFNEFENSTCFTLAHALRVQVAENVTAISFGDTKRAMVKPTVRPTKPLSTASLEVINILLELSSLLPLKELFISCYQNLMAPCALRLEKLVGLEVEKEVVSRIALWLGVAAAAPCLALLRDLGRAMNEIEQSEAQMRDAQAHGVSSVATPRANSVDNESGSQSERHQVLVLAAAAAARAATLLPFNAFSNHLAAFTSSSAVSDKTTLQEIITHGHPLLRRVYFLCEAWWKTHTAITLTHGEIQTLFDKKRFFSKEFVDAVLRTVWYYSSSTYTLGETIDKMELQPYPGYVSLRYQGHHYHNGGSPVMGSNIIQDLSSALSKTVQKSGSRLYSNLRLTKRSGGSLGNETSEDDSEDFNDPRGESSAWNSSSLEARWGGRSHAYSPTMRSCRRTPVGRTLSFPSGPNAELAESSAHSGTTSPFLSRRCDATLPKGAAWEHRHLSWPMCCGKLTFIIRSLPIPPPRQKDMGEIAIEGGAQKKDDGDDLVKNSRRYSTTPVPAGIRVTGPPVVLVLLQLLHKVRRRPEGTSASQTPTTFEWLCTHMPMKTPKIIMGHLLHSLLRVGLVQREVHHEVRQYWYWLPDQLSHIRVSKVTIDLTSSLQEFTFAKMDLSHHAAHPSRATHSSANSESRRVATGGDSRLQSCQSSPKALCLGSANLSERKVPQRKQMPAHGLNSPEERFSRLVFMTEVRRVELCIVQVMKTSHTLTHSELFECVVQRLKDCCSVSVSLFKASISNLIEREFIKNQGYDKYVYVV